MNAERADERSACCARPDDACVFDKALLARAAGCAHLRRQPVGEREALLCAHPPARYNCETLLALARERATFALRLPPPGRPLLHAQALRLQCGGLAALAAEAGPRAVGREDVSALTAALHSADTAFAELPWERLVPAIAAWQPRRRWAPR
ncbi:hypothetical protein KAK06_18075 [Ideonella sp. 4Y11]|uniref:Uncharacterized protein n=1 Tax=Ideonella aquatica TaxID=2824119 RepID=A0A941BLE2_9BURK|nr:hypothetical protein [Ideonella aquatica]MBQ0960868.1 hypothetical protein [Ideonella aquatica]